MFVRRSGLAAAFALVAGLLLLASAAIPAFADSPHVRAARDTSSCAACHSVHAATGPVLTRTGKASDTVTASCLLCHSGGNDNASDIASDFALPSGHTLNSSTPGTVKLGGCDTCHEVHGASEDARRIPAKKVNGVAVSSAGKELCLACHESSEAWFGPGYPSTSSPTRDATGYPVAGTWTGSSTYESPANAHRLIPETTRTVGLSEPVAREQGDCLYCHASHGGANAYDGLLTTYTVPSQDTLSSDQANGSFASLCFECHGTTKPSGFATAPVDIKQFATASAPTSGAPGGHSIVSSGGLLPVGSPLPCFECHNPHGSKRGNSSLITDERGASLTTTGSARVRQFCFTCHTTSDTTAGWSSTTETYTAVTSADKVVGLPRDGGALGLSVAEGHAQGDSASCYQCHGNSYDTGGHNVHNPDTGLGVVPFALGLVSVPETSTVSTGSVLATGSAETTRPLGAAIPTDTTPPLTMSDAVATYTVEATITLVAVDDTGGAGVADTYWALDGGQSATGTVVATSAVGPHTLSYWSVDLAGNVESETVTGFTIEAAQSTDTSPAVDPMPTTDTSLTPNPVPETVATSTVDANQVMALPELLAAKLGEVIASAGP